MKHAYLIIAHNEFNVLRRLIAALDDERNDIYVHIDRKVKTLPSLSTRVSRLVILDKRIDVRWAHVSQIETEMLLFETALANGPYDRYHMISGTHLPIKSNDCIDAFFNQYPDTELLHFWPFDDYEADTKIRIRNWFVRYYKSSNSLLRTFSQLFWNANQKLHRMFGIHRMKEQKFYKSDNWVSLTHGAVTYLVENSKGILKKYRHSFCGDEFFVATELRNAGERFKMADSENLLYVDFVVGAPRTLSARDEQALIESSCMFARKFDSTDAGFLDRITKLSNDGN